MEKMKMLANFWSGSLYVGEHLEELGLDGKIIFKCILNNQCMKLWTGCIWLVIRTSGLLI
jgi:hypothetical protein